MNVRIPFLLLAMAAVSLLVTGAVAEPAPEAVGAPSEPPAATTDADKAKARAAWSPRAPLGIPEGKTAAKDAELPFAPGEKLTYDLLVMGAKAGTGTLSVGEPKRIEGYRVLPLIGTMKSSAFFDNVYRVRDTMASMLVMGPRPFPLRTQFKSERKSVQREFDYRFDLRKQRVKGSRTIVDGDTRTERPLDAAAPGYTHDVLSWIYHMRSVPMTAGESFEFLSHSGNWLYTAKCEVQAVESVWTKLGHMDAYKVRMNVTRRGDDKFRQRATVWYSADDDRLPLRITFEFSLGKSEAVLTDYVPGGGAKAAAAKKEAAAAKKD